MNKALLVFTLILATTFASFTDIDTADATSLSPDRGISINGAFANQYLGQTVSNVGDFNGDDHDDFIITTPTAVAYIVFGLNRARSKDLNLTLTEDDTMPTTDVITIQAPAGAAYLVGGHVGDINRDGYSDFIIGIPGKTGENGAAYVVYGRENPVDIDLDDYSSASSLGFTFTNIPSGSNFGFSVANCEDINGDGIDDFAVSAPNADAGNGYVYVIVGKAIDSSGQQTRTANIDLSNLGDDGFIISGEVNTYFGAYIATVGDVNGDGRDDLAIGAPAGDLAYIIYAGTPTGSAAFGNVDIGNANDAGKFTKITGTPGTQFGYNVGYAGDFNGDTYKDVFIGAPYGDPGSRIDTGIVYVIFGRNIPGGDKIPDVNVATLNTSTGITISGGTSNDTIGWESDGVGDVNGDGVDDIALGVPGPTDEDGNFIVQGKAYVIFGKKGIGNIDLITPPANDVGSIILGSAVIEDLGGDGFGYSVSGIGDVSGDGFPDFLLAAPHSNPVVNLTDQRGTVVLLYGQPKSIFASRIGAGLLVLGCFLIALIL